MKKFVVMSGGFHPFHAGHADLYQQAKEAFPDAKVLVCATNVQSDRPFPFSLKKKLAQLSGVPPKDFIEVSRQFTIQDPALAQRIGNPDDAIVIYVRSDKDRNEAPQPWKLGPDGKPPVGKRGAKKGLPLSDYLLEYPGEGQPLDPVSKHAYMAYLKTVEFGPGITSASEIRNAWPKLNKKRKLAMVMSLYPTTKSNPQLAQNVVGMFDQVMGAELTEGFNSNDILDEAAPWVDKLGLGNFFRKAKEMDADSQSEIRILSGVNHTMQLYFKTILALNAQVGPAASLFWPILGKQALLFAGGALIYTIGKILATKVGRAVFGSTEEALAFAKAHLAAAQQKNTSSFVFDGKTYPVTVKDSAAIEKLYQQIVDLEQIMLGKKSRELDAEFQKSLKADKLKQQGLPLPLKENDIDEGWKEKVGAATLAGGVALGGLSSMGKPPDTNWDKFPQQIRTQHDNRGNEKIMSVTGPNSKGEYRVRITIDNDIQEYITKTPPKSLREAINKVEPISKSVPIQKTVIHPVKQHMHSPPEKKTTPAVVNHIKPREVKEFAPPGSDDGGGDSRSRRIRKLLEIAIKVAKEKNIDELGMIHGMNMIAGDEFFNTAVEGILSDITDKEYMFVLQSAYKTVKQGMMEGLGIPYPTTYEQENNKFKRRGPMRITAMTEFAPPDSDDREPDEEEILRQLAAQWWNGSIQQMKKAQQTLQAMGWDIGQDESGDDDAGVFVIRIGDENGDSYIAFNHSDLDLNEDYLNEV